VSPATTSALYGCLAPRQRCQKPAHWSRWADPGHLKWNDANDLSIIRHVPRSEIFRLNRHIFLELAQIISQDRLILEETILPHFARSISVHKVLFVVVQHIHNVIRIFSAKEY
jgi:hypothetical protein